MEWNGTFKNKLEKSFFVELSKVDGNNSTVNLKFADDPIEIKYESTENIYKPIKASTATISLVVSEYDNDLYAISGRDIKVVIYDATDDIIVWKGYLTPNVYSQDYDEEITEMELECQDELSALKFISANKLSGTYTLRELIMMVLDTTEDNVVMNFDSMHLVDTVRQYYNNKGTKKLYVDDILITDQNIDDYNNILDSMMFNSSLFHTKEEEEELTYFDVLEQIFTFLNLTIYQECGKFHIIQYDNNDFDTVDLNYSNMDCQLNKTSTYKSFKYVHKPKLKTQEFDLFEQIKGNKEKDYKFASRNPYSTSIKCPNVLVESVFSPFSYRYGRTSNTMLPEYGSNAGLLDMGSIPSSFTYKFNLPDSFKQYTHKSPTYTSGALCEFCKYPDDANFKSTFDVKEEYGYWDWLKCMSADFVKLGVETENEESLGLLIHQPIQDYKCTTDRTETDIMFFYRTDDKRFPNNIHDNNWDESDSKIKIDCPIEQSDMWYSFAPVLTFETDIDVDEFTEFLSFEVEGKAILNPEMFIGKRNQYSTSNWPTGYIKQMDEENGSTDKGGWNNHYAFKIRIPIELEVGNDYRFSRNVYHNGNDIMDGGLFDGIEFPTLTKKTIKPFKKDDVYMLELSCDTVDLPNTTDNNVIVQLKGKVKVYDAQGETFKTKYSTLSNGLNMYASTNSYGLKDVENSAVLSFDNVVGAKGKLKCTIFSLPPAHIYDSGGAQLSMSDRSDGSYIDAYYRYVGYWLQGFFITKFNIKEHQRNEVVYERIYDTDSDEDVEYKVPLNADSFEEFDEIECMIGNHNSFVTPISRPSLIRYYKESDETNGIKLWTDYSKVTNDKTTITKANNQKEIDLWLNNKSVKMEDFTIENIKNQYSNSNIILDIKTHTGTDFNAMSHYYTYSKEFNGRKFIANEVTYNLKNDITELNLQEKK